MILFLRWEQSLLSVSINSLFTVKYLIKVCSLFSTDNGAVVSFHTTSQQFTSIKSDELTKQRVYNSYVKRISHCTRSEKLQLCKA